MFAAVHAWPVSVGYVKLCTEYFPALLLLYRGLLRNQEQFWLPRGVSGNVGFSAWGASWAFRHSSNTSQLVCAQQELPGEIPGLSPVATRRVI